MIDKEQINLFTLAGALITAILFFIDWFIAKKGREKVHRWVRVRYVLLKRTNTRKLALFVVRKSFHLLRTFYTGNRGFFTLASLILCSIWAFLRIGGYALLFSGGEQKLIESGIIETHPFINEHQRLAEIIVNLSNWPWVVLYGMSFGLIVWASSGVTGLLLERIVKADKLRLLLIYIPLDFIFSGICIAILLVLNILLALFFFILFFPKEYLAKMEEVQLFLTHFTIADMSGLILYPSFVYLMMFVALTSLLVFGRAVLLFLAQFFLAVKDSDSSAVRLVGIGTATITGLLIAMGRLL